MNEEIIDIYTEMSNILINILVAFESMAPNEAVANMFMDAANQLHDISIAIQDLRK